MSVAAMIDQYGACARVRSVPEQTEAGGFRSFVDKEDRGRRVDFAEHPFERQHSLMTRNALVKVNKILRQPRSVRRIRIEAVGSGRDFRTLRLQSQIASRARYKD